MEKKQKQKDHLKTPFRAYKGKKPYIFVSYAHVDANKVFPELIRFYNQGYNIWYDQGISPGSEWPEEIEEALEKSSLFVVFISSHAVESRNVRNEINFALNEDIPLIAIYLEETKLKYGLKLGMGSIQGILKYSMSEDEYVFKYTNAFKREGIEPSKKDRKEIIEEYGDVDLKDENAYVFASYDIKDEELVLPELRRLKSQGLNIKCINFDDDMDNENKISECSLFLVYISSNSLNSLIVREEISMAHLEEIPFFVIYLEDVELRRGIKLQMASKESINRYEMSEEDYAERCTHTLKRHGFRLIDTKTLKTTNEDYIYVSFDVKDKDEAMAQINEFRDLGLNIEYDASEGEDEESVDVLLNASLFVVFISPNSIRSNVVRDEIYVALSEEIPFIAIYLSETKITTGLKRQLDSKLAIFKYQIDETEYIESYIDAFRQNGFVLIESNEESLDLAKVEVPDERLTSDYLKEFDEMNTTTKSIFDLEGNEILIILEDGTNLTNWDDVKNKEDIIYISEDLSSADDLKRKYKGLKSLKAIVVSEISDNVTNFDLMFNSCESLVDISSLGAWDTSNITSMRSMFAGCSSLEDFSPLKEWKTSNVKDMGNIFANCKSLNDLSFLKDWKVSKVTNMKSLFRGCRSITDLSCLSQWKTSKVKNMGNVFDGCRNLTDLSGLSKWNVSKATTMQSMFRFCNSIVDLSGLSQWNVSNVKAMDEMFKNCGNITDLSYLNEWDVCKLESRNNIFDGCESLEEYPKWCMKDKQPEIEPVSEESDIAPGIHVDSFNKLTKSIKKGAEISITSDIDFEREIEINNDDVIIHGNGHTFNAGFKRCFMIKGHDVKFDSLTFKNGFSDKNYRGYDEKTRDMDCEYRGGAIYNDGSCSFLNCNFVDNHIGEKLWYDRSRTNIRVYYVAKGAAIYSSGSCILESCSFENNTDKGSGKDSPCYGVTFKDEEPAEIRKTEDLNDSHSDDEISGIDTIPFPAYRGNDPYAFISYSHLDANRIFPDIAKFHDAGYNIWYDEGITPGQDWDEEIAEALENCSLFVCFISENSLESRNVVNEIKFALNENKEIILIYLDNIKLSGSLKLRLADVKSILKSHLTEEKYIEKCLSVFKSMEESSTESVLETDKEESSFIKNSPFKAYTGNDPYIFVAYSHIDADRIFPDIERFHNEGFNIWYDQGIPLGSNWGEEIGNAIENCSLFVVFLSSNAVESDYVRNEIFLAINNDIPVLVIYLEKTELKYGLKLGLGSSHAIFKNEMSEDNYIERCISDFKKFGFEPKQLIESKEDEPKRETNLNKNKVVDIPEPYEGHEPYIYVCYKHADSNIVFPVIKQLSDAGFNIWHDGNLKLGTSYDTQIADHVRKSSLFVIFITKNMMESAEDINDYCIKEMKLAINMGINTLPIYLEDVNLKGFYLMHCMDKQSIFKFEFENYDEKFIEACTNTFKDFGLEPKANNQESVPKPKNRDIYISYSTKDSEIAMDVCSFLESNGKTCWIAPRDLLIGSYYLNQINDAIMNAKTFLLIYSRNSSQSKYVENETHRAFSLEKQIITFNIDGSELSKDFKFTLMNSHMLDGSNNPKNSYGSILDIINNKYDPKPEKSESKPKKKGFMSRLFGR